MNDQLKKASSQLAASTNTQVLYSDDRTLKKTESSKIKEHCFHKGSKPEQCGTADELA